jgi:hypothetical protein
VLCVSSGSVATSWTLATNQSAACTH